jgi:hypothetical protein
MRDTFFTGKGTPSVFWAESGGAHRVCVSLLRINRRLK